MMKTADGVRTKTLAGEALLLGMLGKALYAIPEESWLLSLLDRELFAEAPFASDQPKVVRGLKLLVKWSRDYEDGLPAEAVTALQVDHTQLFSGLAGMPVAPWESVYFNDERMVFQEQTLDVRAWYRRFGLEAEKLGREPDDHIGLEMSFLAHLARLALEAWQAQDQARFDEILRAQRGFLEEHPLLWAQVWANQVIKHAQTDFYRGLALVTWGALKELAVLHDLTMREVDES
jgi:TorA maturation chaperone TorD